MVSADICPFHPPPRQFAMILVAAMLAACAAAQGRNADTAASPPGVFVAIDDTTADFRPTAELVSRERLKNLGVTFEPDGGRAAALRLDLRLEYRNLTDVDGHTRSYEELDSTVAWLWLFQGPRCGDTPSQEELASVTRPMLDAIFDRMIQDKVFALDALAAVGAQPPLVHVATNRGQEIARQVLRVDRPFERWTMAEGASTTPDYRTDLFFDLGPGGFSGPRAMLGIMTAGLFGVCRSTPISLVATVTSPNAMKSKSYAVAESVRGHLKGDECEPQNEATRPDVFARLLRNVLSKMERDDLIRPVVPGIESGAPWVVVTSNIAKGIVRAETIHSQQIPRYLFSDAAEYAPGYSLRLEIEFQGGGRKEQGGLGTVGTAIALTWFGRTAGCEPGVLVLDAVLRDAANGEVKRYHLPHEFKHSGDTEAFDCKDNELTNPEIVAESVRSLYSEMKADGTLALLSARQRWVTVTWMLDQVRSNLGGRFPRTAASPSRTSASRKPRNSSASEASKLGPASRSQLLSACLVQRIAVALPAASFFATSSAVAWTSASSTQSATSPIRSASAPDSGWLVSR